MKVWEGRAKSGQAHPLAASPPTPTLRVGAKLNVVVVTVEIPATAGVSFQPDAVYSYDVEITDSSNTARTLKTLRGLGLSRAALALPGREGGAAAGAPLSARRTLDILLGEIEMPPRVLTDLTVLVPPASQKELSEAVRLRASRS